MQTIFTYEADMSNTAITEDEPPTLAERYQRATVSSHLRVQDKRCDADYLMAAASANKLGPLLMRLRSEFDTVRASVRAGPLNRTELVLALSHLSTLPAARNELGALAIWLATKQLFMQPDAQVLVIAGRVLDVWISPTCDACDGRGFNGGTHRGEQRVRCGGCRGFGERRANLGDTLEDKRFARLLLDAMADLMRRAEDEMRLRLRDS